MRLRETWRRRHENTLSINGYRQAGGATGAIARTADTVYDQLTAAEQDIAKRLFLRLTALGEGAEDSRRRVPVDVLAANDTHTMTVLHTLTSARLITADTDAEGRDVDELAHEALLREWPRLREWLDEDRDELRTLSHLETAARDWHAAGQPDTDLYAGTRLETAETIAPDKLNDRERNYPGLPAWPAEKPSAETPAAPAADSRRSPSSSSSCSSSPPSPASSPSDNAAPPANKPVRRKSKPGWRSSRRQSQPPGIWPPKPRPNSARSHR